MPARPIHRFGAEDRLFREARAGAPDMLAAGDVALFGLARDPDAARAIRDASWFCSARGDARKLADLGDATAAAGAVAAMAMRRGAFPYLLGGDAADGAAVARVADGATKIVISARLDLAPAELAAGRLLAIGVHDLLPAASVHAWRAGGGTIVPAAGSGSVAARARAALDAHGSDEAVAVVLDLGVVDTGHAAGTPGLNVGGMSALDLLDTLRALAARARIVAMATIGLAPERDPRGHSELLAAEALALSSMSARGLGSQS